MSVLTILILRLLGIKPPLELEFNLEELINMVAREEVKGQE